MTIYNINLGIGWASSGVEYAQAYRAGVLREVGLDAKFIFTDMFQLENLAHYTANIGFKDSEVMWLYGAFTDVKVAPTTYPLEVFEQTLNERFARENVTDHYARYKDEERDVVVTVFFRKDHPGVVQKVEYLSKGKLIRKDYYSYTKMFTEYYAPYKEEAHRLYQRTFFNEDGSVAYEENCDGDKSVYRFKDRIIFSKEELLGYMLDCLALTKDDIILVDRATGTGQAIFRHRGDAKVAVVVHAEHYSANAVTDHTILWNNYYEYQFSNADKVDAFIVSTEAQRQTLQAQFRQFTDFDPKIFTIPVGSLDSLAFNEGERKPYSLLTCSRLASEKHIDWLVQAVLVARQTLPELTFDIYGEGGQRDKLNSMIEEAGAQDYIRLMGHHDLSQVYKNYEIYLSGSTSEGFGLTLMEAIGSGLPLIGLDVPYGNQTFVEQDKNGHLIQRTEPDDVQHYAQVFAQALIDIYQSGSLPAYREHSYQLASAFLKEELEAAWQSFVREV